MGVFILRAYLYTNDFDYVIAGSVEEANRFACNFHGYLEDDDEVEWYQVSDDFRFTLHEEIEGGIIPRTQTAKEWVSEKGRGFLACSEW